MVEVQSKVENQCHEKKSRYCIDNGSRLQYNGSFQHRAKEPRHSKGEENPRIEEEKFREKSSFRNSEWALGSLATHYLFTNFNESRVSPLFALKNVNSGWASLKEEWWPVILTLNHFPQEFDLFLLIDIHWRTRFCTHYSTSTTIYDHGYFLLAQNGSNVLNGSMVFSVTSGIIGASSCDSFTGTTSFSFFLKLSRTHTITRNHTQFSGSLPCESNCFM
ncbi:hypothetical protein HUJ04_002694 [Dendroctonus ponderosae]|nr:hypothetical protein HUJ04_002694 [Dendroctonus ponderosae]